MKSIPLSLYIRINPLRPIIKWSLSILSHYHTGNRQPINHNIALLCVISSGVNLPRGNHPVWSVGEPGSINHNLKKMIFLSLEFWEPGSISHNLK